MFCKNCGNSLNDNAKFCPKCGNPVETQAQYEEEFTEAEEFTGYSNDDAVLTDAPCEEADFSAEETIGFVPQNEEEFVPVQKKKSKKWLVAIPLALIVIIVAGLVFAGPYVTTFAKRLIMSEADYFKSVAKGEAIELAEDIAINIDALSSTYKENSTPYAEGSLKITLGDALPDVISTLGEIDVTEYISWIEDVEVGCNTSIANKEVGVGLDLDLNGKEIAEIKCAITPDQLYLTLPGLLNKGICAPMQESADVELDAIQKNAKELYNLCPSKEVSQKLIEKYAVLLIDSVTEVSETKTTVEIEDETRKVLCLSTEIDADTANKAATAVCKEARNDEEIKKILSKAEKNELINPYDSDFTGDFKDGIDEFLDELDDFDEDDFGEVTFSLYVDAKGDVLGMSLEADGLEFESTIFDVKEGYLSRYYLNADDTEISITGKGDKNEKKNTLTSEYILNVNDNDIIKLNLDGFNTEQFKKGRIVGKVSISPAKDVVDLLGFVSDDVKDLVGNLKIKYEGEYNDDKKTSSKIALTTSGKEIITLSAEGSATDKKSANYIPDEYYNVEDLETDPEASMEFTTDVGNAVSTLITRLDDAGLPPQIKAYIEEQIGMNFGGVMTEDADFEEDIEFEEDMYFEEDMDF